MKIEMRDPKLLVVYENNPKDHPPEQVAAIMQSIKNFGFDQPVVIDSEGVIIKGHGRTLAAIKLGMSEIPVLVKEGTPDTHRLNRILDNKLQSRDYDHVALLDDLLVLKNADSLELSLFTDSTLPMPKSAVQTADFQLFSLGTKHSCPSCNYRW